LVAGFDFGKFARSMPKFNDAELTRLNARILQATPFAAVAERLQAMAPVDEAFWVVVRPNIKRLGDVASWWAVAHGPVTPVIEDADYIALALERLPAEPWDANTWGAWTRALAAHTSRRGKQLFMPLRQALTGMGQGPEMAPLLPLIGRTRAAGRLRGEIGQAP
jgi:glutamyl-tRNA synthetase